MKTQTTKNVLFKSLLSCALLLIPFGLFAAPLAYICGTGAVTLKYSGSYTLVSGDQTVWQEVSSTGTPIGAAVTITSAGVAGDADLALTGGATSLATAGEHFYRVHVLTATPGGCTGDVSDAVSIYMLPTFTVALTPTSTSYCEAGTTNTTASVITASATPASTLPTGVKLVYAWAGSNGGTASGTDNNTYTMTTTTVGSYTVATQASFDVSATGVPLRSSANSPCTETASTTITVSPRPGKPTISI